MPVSEKQNFVYLNRAGGWPGFSASGLERSTDGALRLYPLAQLTDSLPAAVLTLATGSEPGGVAVDTDGNLYWTDPGQNRIFCRKACDGSVAWLPCVGGKGSTPGKFRGPRGLCVPPDRNALFVTDSGNHRIQVLDPQTGEVLAIWPRTAGSIGATVPGSVPFDAPSACA